MKRILGETTAGREEIKTLQASVAAIAAKLDAIAPKPAEPAAAPPSGIEAQVQALATAVTGIVSEKQQAEKAERRKAITAAVAGAATEQGRELIRGALATMALDGEVDLHAQDATGEADRALAKLRARHPGAFAAPASSAPAPSGSFEQLPPGVELHQLTPEQLERLSPEAFSKLSRQSRTSGLAF